MSRDHIIPRFILRGFVLDPTENKKHQKIMIYDKETKQLFVEEINDAYALEDFNSPETERYLANKYESKVAKLFQRISETVNKDQKFVAFSESEYKLLIRFFVIMWRRNDIQLEKAKEMASQFDNIMKSLSGVNYNKLFNAKYDGQSVEKIFNDNIEDIRVSFYDKVIRETTNDDPTVLKTIRYYRPIIVENKSKIHFLLHNTYSTLRYMVPKNQLEVSEADVPSIMLYPISRTLCFCLLYNGKGTELSKDTIDIPIECWNSDDDIKLHFIHGYITPTAKSFIVDETNVEFVKESMT